ncbi:hypothetical protein QOT17_006882 [Balamuthia mandrillaris]
MSLWHRLLNYWANQVFVEGLSNSRWFQRFVVRTNQKVKSAVEQGKRRLEDTPLAEKQQELRRRLDTNSSYVSQFGSEFFKNFTEEVSKKMKDINRKKNLCKATNTF